VWLKKQGYSKGKIKKFLFLNKFGNRFLLHSRVKFITKKEYSDSLTVFLKFLRNIKISSNQKSDEKNFQKIFNLKKWKRGFKMYLFPKGLNSYDLLKIKPLRKVEEIKFKNVCLKKLPKREKFTLIISTNVIEGFTNPFTFFQLIQPLLSRNGFIEVTTYNEFFARWLKYLKILINTYQENENLRNYLLGNAYLFQGKNEKMGKEYLRKLELNKNTFIFSRSEVNEISKLLSEKKFLPLWMRNSKINRKTFANSLFKNREKGYLIKK